MGAEEALMKKTTILAGAAITAAIAATPILLARQAGSFPADHRPGGGPVMMRLERLRQLGEELDLTADQRAALRSLARETFAANRRYRETLRDDFLTAGLVLLKNPDDTAAAGVVLD